MAQIKQIFKGEELTRTKVKNNILRIWDLTTEDERYDWYKEAHDYAGQLMHDIDETDFTERLFSICCGVISALSPLKTWKENKRIAKVMLETLDCGQMGQFKKKALDIIESDGKDETILDILNGRKISAFYLNMKYPDVANHLTIDRHALSIALGRRVTDADYAGMTARQYEFFVQCYTLAGIEVGESPLLMQSATWVKWRKN